MFNLGSITNLLRSRTPTSVFGGEVINPLFVPLDLKILDATIGSLFSDVRRTGGNAYEPRVDLTHFRNKIANFVLSKYRNYIILSSREIVVNGTRGVRLDQIVKTMTPAIVYVGSKNQKNIVGVLFNSYNAAQSELIDDYINRELVSFLDENLKSKNNQFDLAYILENEPQSNTAKKVSILISILNSFSRNKVDVHPDIPIGASNTLHTEMLVSSLLSTYSNRKEYGSAIQTTVRQEVSSFLHSIKAEIVIIQDASEKDATIKAMQSDKFAKQLGEKLVGNSAQKESLFGRITSRIASIFTTGKSEAKSSKSSVKLDPIDNRHKARINTRIGNGSHTSYTIPNNGMSTISLMNLLNEKLYETVRKHMGNGSAVNVLNYRTGRLAKSFQVTAVSRERSQALTAFFTYMKYPYSTFAPFGVQEKPRTRDPKLLGEASIREIAEKQITTRLRAVLV